MNGTVEFWDNVLLTPLERLSDPGRTFIGLTDKAHKFGLDALRVLVHEGLASIKHRTAVQPLLWLCGTFSLGCFLIAALAKDPWLRHGLFIVGAVPLALLAFAYIYFMFSDPDRLHSEEFQLKRRSLSIVESKGGRIAILPVDLSTDPFPKTKLLASGAEEEDGK